MQNRELSEQHAGQVKEYRSGEAITAEGEKQEACYVILEGAVEIFQHNKSIRVLKAADVFGLESIFLKKSVTTTARVLGPARIAVYHRDVIEQIIASRSQVVTTIIASLISQLEQTTQVAQEYMPAGFMLDVNQHVYEAGAVIIEEGTAGKDIFMLLESEQGLLVTRKGKEVGSITRPGEYFGEMSGLLGEKRTATVRSLGKSLVQIFPGEELEATLMAYPRLAKQIIDTLALRLRKANERIAGLATDGEAHGMTE